MKYLKFIGSAIVALGLIFVLNKPQGSIPALGFFFSPFHGFLQNIMSSEDLSDEIFIKGVKDEVKVVYDDNYVPHVFAKNEDDLYFAQGYLVAADRLWQMEFYTLVASGRLTEIVGSAAFELDKYNRRLGMARAAAEIIEEQKNDPLAWATLNAYTEGVNAYINQLKDKDLPVEYKILGYKPEAWSPYKTVLMLMNMRKTLSARTDDFRLTNVLAKYGIDTVNELFPDYPAYESPVIPSGTKWNFTPVEVKTPDVKLPKLQEEVLSHYFEETNPGIGSNNWAVHGSKSASGLPILANDPHLGLTLPSIWYEIQLSAPGVNVYGVTLPGVPGVIIGFNKDIAWGVTNVGSDVLDFYKVQFKDSTQTEYFHDGQWKPTRIYIEEFKFKNGKKILDTLVYTHHGPVVYNDQRDSNLDKDTPAGHAMKWQGLDAEGSDLMTFYLLNRAKDYTDYRKALTYYNSPAQNFIFADNQNNIAITANGKLPLKWKGQGKFTLDGTNPEHDWPGYIPADQNPTVKNPARGFVSSANQFSADPTYPYYLGWHFAPAYRGKRINDRLEKMKDATPDSLRALQNDNYNLEAERLLPAVLPYLELHSTQDMQVALESLKSWDLNNDANSMAAGIFDTWVKKLNKWIWADEFPSDDYLLTPLGDKTAQLITNETDSRWFDNITTKDTVETIDYVIVGSFKETLEDLTLKFGPINPETWAWYLVKHTKINHLVPQFTGFSSSMVNNGGGSNIVNATTSNFGPSWRMVVALDKDWPKAYGLYPGGQSGRPASKYYSNMIDDWAKGELYELKFMKSSDEKIDKVLKNIIINPKK